MSTPLWLRFMYRDFYGVPRMILFEAEESLYLLDSQFDDEEDEYRDTYVVYRIGTDAVKWSDPSADWRDLPKHGIEIGTVAVRDVRFDKTKREYLDGSSVFAGANMPGRDLS